MSVVDGVYIYQDAGPSLLAYSINGSTPIAVQTSLNNYATEFLPDRDSGDSVVELSPIQLLYLQKYGHLVIFVPFGVDTPPLTIQRIVLQFVLVAESYLGSQLTPSVVSANKATLVLILSEMIASGIPRITEPNIVGQLLPKNDFMSIIAKAGASVMGGTAGGNSGGAGVAGGLGGSGAGSHASGAGSSAINAAALGKSSFGSSSLSRQMLPNELVPWELSWRSSKVTHLRQELYIDIVEKLKITEPTSKRSSSHHDRFERFSSSHTASKPARVEINGEIRLNALLSGTPVVHLSLKGDNLPVVQPTMGLHRCVDSKTFSESGGRSLTFTPPDGKSLLCTYQLTQTQRNLAILSAKLVRLENQFEVRIQTAIDRKVKEVTGLVATVVFPPGVRTVKEISSTSGEFDTSKPERCELRFADAVPTGWNASLKAVGYNSDKNVVQPLYVELKYSIVGQVSSDMGVKSVHIEQPGAKRTDAPPYKGLRYQMEVESYVIS